MEYDVQSQRDARHSEPAVLCESAQCRCCFNDGNSCGVRGAHATGVVIYDAGNRVLLAVPSSASTNRMPARVDGSVILAATRTLANGLVTQGPGGRGLGGYPCGSQKPALKGD